jgi:hypothetical protein
MIAELKLWVTEALAAVASAGALFATIQFTPSKQRGNMANSDWRCIAAMAANSFVVLVSSDSVRIVFGEKVQGGELTYQSAVTLPRGMAESLVKKLAKLLERGGPSRRAVTATGGETLH